MRWLRTRRDVVLLYHAVGLAPATGDPDNLYVDTETFRRQLAYIRRRADVVPLREVASSRRSGPRQRVAVTFDDGFRSVLLNAAPVLEEFALPATLFMPTGAVRADGPTGDPVEKLSRDELLALQAHGVEIGSHGHAHIDLAAAEADVTRDDLATSYRLLTEWLGSPPLHLAWPFGRSSAAARDAAKELGFVAAFATERSPAGDFARERVGVYPRDSFARFVLKASGRYGPLRRGAAVLERGLVRSKASSGLRG